jgi:integrase
VRAYGLSHYRHGLRAAEACDLRWDQIDFNGAVLHVRRAKNGTPSTHPVQGDELRASGSSARARRRPASSLASAAREKTAQKVTVLALPRLRLLSTAVCIALVPNRLKDFWRDCSALLRRIVWPSRGFDPRCRSPVDQKSARRFNHPIMPKRARSLRVGIWIGGAKRWKGYEGCIREASIPQPVN